MLEREDVGFAVLALLAEAAPRAEGEGAPQDEGAPQEDCAPQEGGAHQALVLRQPASNLQILK